MQLSNSALAIAVQILQQLGWDIGRSDCYRYGKTSWPGGSSGQLGKIRLLIDGAHNPAAAQAYASLSILDTNP